MQDNLEALLRAVGLQRFAPQFADEELTAKLLRTMTPTILLTSLSELGLSPQECASLAEQLHAPLRIKTPPAETPPMVICVDHGLCNRLRAVLSYRQVAAAEGRRLHVVWKKDEQCNGEFLDCFIPLPGVRFSREPPSWAPAPDRCNHVHHSIKGTASESAGYSDLLPSRSVQAMIDARIRELSASYCAIHVRRTDMLYGDHMHFKMTEEEEFDSFLENRHPSLNVYVATDCGITSKRFADRVGVRMKAKHLQPNYSPGHHRQTSLMDAVADLYVCAHGTAFMGSYGSSFSDTILHLRTARGTSSQEDRHKIYRDQDWANREWSGPPGIRVLRRLRTAA